MPVHFEPTEMKCRRQRVSERISELGMDGLLIFKQESMYYLTGYDTFGFSMFQCLVIDTSGHTVLLTRLPDLRQAQFTSDIQDIRIWHDTENANPTLELRDLLESLGYRNKRIGIELDSYGLKAHYWRLLETQLDGFCTLVDTSTLIDQFRRVKSSKEIEYIRRAGELSDDAWNQAVQLTEPGAF